MSGSHKGCRGIFSLCTYIFCLLILKGQCFGTTTMSSNESREWPAGQSVVSSQHAACQKHRQALLPFSSQQIKLWLIVNTLPEYFIRNSPQTYFLPLSFHKSLFSSCARDSTFCYRYCHSASPVSPPAWGRSHPTYTAGAQHKLLSLALPRVQTRVVVYTLMLY